MFIELEDYLYILSVLNSILQYFMKMIDNFITEFRTSAALHFCGTYLQQVCFFMSSQCAIEGVMEVATMFPRKLRYKLQTLLDI